MQNTFMGFGGSPQQNIAVFMLVVYFLAACGGELKEGWKNNISLCVSAAMACHLTTATAIIAAILQMEFGVLRCTIYGTGHALY